MTDYPEAVREYDKLRALYDNDPSRRNFDFDVASRAIAALKKELLAAQWMLHQFASGEFVAYDPQYGEDSEEKVMADLAARYEADAIIPLNEEQAEAFKALSESIKTEQSLRDEVAALKKDRDYYRDHYELVFKQRNEAERRVAELEPVVRHERNPHTTHYDGCYQYHFDCAIERIAELEADYREALNNNGVLKDLEAEQKDRAEEADRRYNELAPQLSEAVADRQKADATIRDLKAMVEELTEERNTALEHERQTRTIVGLEQRKTIDERNRRRRDIRRLEHERDNALDRVEKAEADLFAARQALLTEGIARRKK